MGPATPPRGANGPRHPGEWRHGSGHAPPGCRSPGHAPRGADRPRHPGERRHGSGHAPRGADRPATPLGCRSPQAPPGVAASAWPLGTAILIVSRADMPPGVPPPASCRPNRGHSGGLSEASAKPEASKGLVHQRTGSQLPRDRKRKPHFQTMLKSKLNVLTLKKEPLPAVIFHEPEAIELCTTTPLMKSRTHSGCKRLLEQRPGPTGSSMNSDELQLSKVGFHDLALLVTYLGKVPTTGMQFFSGCTEKPVIELWKKHTLAREDIFPANVLLEIRPFQVCLHHLDHKGEATVHMDTFQVARIAYCTADHNVSPNIFAWVYREINDDLSYQMDCHAVECESKLEAKKLAHAMMEAFKKTFHSMKSDGRIHRNSSSEEISHYSCDLSHVSPQKDRRGGAGLWVARVADWAGGMLSSHCQWWRELSVCAMAVLRHRRGLWGSEPTSCCGPSKAWELGACPLRHQAFQKPPLRRRLLKALCTRGQAPRSPAIESGELCVRSGTSGPPAIKSREQAASSVRGAVPYILSLFAVELGACPLVHQAFQKPPARQRLLKGLVPEQTGTQLPHFDDPRWGSHCWRRRVEQRGLPRMRGATDTWLPCR
ncbi:hypothetical protein QTO34_002740 [Cnephaeus nilssonii]|uniref:PTB-containing, cubilin and LRP1-interacting protein n=1 Tax=Cnephaeus nilssonii TaxID=3371016 RepID=A0AA40LKW3_CNENI|nr:hypothetical protein QTO34_002740 [Eptesicus nilssonii]